MAKKQQNPADYIVPLNMNGLQGRMLHMPAPKNSVGEILFVYGHHSSLERWWGLMQNLNRYGAVTMPDLPGFGGMDSFYKIGEQASLDDFADYLAAFIKMRYKRSRVTIAGMSFGFVIVTRMLQRYPDLAKKITMVVSIAGFAHRDDFTFTKPRGMFYRLASRFFSLPGAAGFFRHVCLNPLVIRTIYRHTHNAKDKFRDMTGEALQETTDFEIHLWHANDVRTHMRTCADFLNLDNTKAKVNLPVYHVAIAADRYFDNQVVEQHMRMIFSEFNLISMLKVDNHAPSIIADAKSAAPFIPPKLRRLLLQYSKKTK